MGYSMGKPTIEDGDIYLRYFNGDACHIGKRFESRRSTTIKFVCNPYEQGPRFIEETDFCEYVFEWQTPAACPLDPVVRLPVSHSNWMCASE